MTSANIFIWRVRLCVLLAVAGQSFVDFGKHGGIAQRENAMQGSVQHVKCAIQPRDARGAAASKGLQDCDRFANRPAPARRATTTALGNSPIAGERQHPFK